MNVCVSLLYVCVAETERNDKTTYIMVKTKLKFQVIFFSFLNSDVVFLTFIFLYTALLKIKLFPLEQKKKMKTNI